MRHLFAAIAVFVLVQARSAAYSLSLSCNESSGTVAHDLSTNGFDFQVSGASWTGGIARNGLHFDGSDDFLTTSNGMCLERLGSMQTGTIAVSFQLHSLPVSTVYPIFYFGKADGSYIIIEVGHHNQESKLYFTVSTNGIPLCFDANVNLQTHIWYRFVAVVGTNFNTGYMNGIELTNRHYNYGNARSSFFLANVANEVCWLGKGYSASTEPTCFDGKIDEFRISQRPFDSQEVSAAYNALMSVLGVSLQWQATAGVLLRWPSQVNEKFDLLYRMSLADIKSWVILASNLPATEAETTFLDADGKNASSGFYRVIRSPY